MRTSEGGPHKGKREGRALPLQVRRMEGEFYLVEKISGLEGLAAEELATMLRVASTSLVTGGRQISVLQAW